jgi:hypothetical protein
MLLLLKSEMHKGEKVKQNLGYYGKRRQNGSGEF